MEKLGFIKPKTLGKLSVIPPIPSGNINQNKKDESVTSNQPKTTTKEKVPNPEKLAPAADKKVDISEKYVHLEN